ncbi:nucleotide exchange factor GrpE [Caenispirillum salinarum]|uniref:nucleotide exchange factor GrpE n=1 Tax=Caenispirillum salinarum TaxID=859058 RepID=UPI00384ADDDB
MAQQHNPAQAANGAETPNEAPEHEGQEGTHPGGTADTGEQSPQAGDIPQGSVPDEEAQAAAADNMAPEERIAMLEGEVQRLKTEYMRALADAENSKRMAEKRIEDNSKYAVSNFAKEMLTVADNLDRALLAAPEDKRKNNELLKNLAVGIEMTQKTLTGALEKYGVQKVEARGAAFDPNLHQAVQEVENPDVPAGTCVEVYQDGYLIRDRLLRPAMVVVSRGGPKRDAGNGNGGGAQTPEGGQGGVDTSA